MEVPQKQRKHRRLLTGLDFLYQAMRRFRNGVPHHRPYVRLEQDFQGRPLEKEITQSAAKGEFDKLPFEAIFPMEYRTLGARIMQSMRFVTLVAVVGLLFATTCDSACGQISDQEGKWVVSRGADIASKCADFIKTEYGDRTGGAVFENAELVRLVTADPASWRFYSRDRGILIAIDISADVSSTIHNSGRAKIARAAEAVIRQEREMSITDRVTVVFIDPAAHELAAQRSYGLPVYSRPIPISGYMGWEHAVGPVGSSHSTGGSTNHTCGCR